MVGEAMHKRGLVVYWIDGIKVWGGHKGDKNVA